MISVSNLRCNTVYPVPKYDYFISTGSIYASSRTTKSWCAGHLLMLQPPYLMAG